MHHCPLAEVTCQIRADLQREKQQHFDRQLTATFLADRKVEARRDRLPATTASAHPIASPPSANSLRIP